MKQAELEAEVWRNVREIRYQGQPLFDQGDVIAMFGYPDDPDGGVQFTTDGTPELDLVVIHKPEKQHFDVFVTRIGDSPNYFAADEREIPETTDVLPERIFVAGDYFLDTYRANLPFSERHYAVYAEVCRELKPKSIMEIGVRAGYSAWTMLSVVPDATYVGVDVDNGTHGGVKGYIDHAETMLRREYPSASVTIMRADSQRMLSLDRHYDLIHIDGAHNHDQAMHDLELCAPFADYLLVDDASSITTVRSALDEFLAEHHFDAWRYETWRGLTLIDTRPAAGKYPARYCPEVFERASIEDAKAVILTEEPNFGLTTGHRWVKETEWLMQKMIFPAGTIFDIGCGIGRLSKPLLHRHRVIGVDGSASMRAGAEEYVDNPGRFAAISPEIFRNMVFHREITGQGAFAVWALQHMMPADLRALLGAVWEGLEPGAPFYTMDGNTRFLPIEFKGTFGWLDDGFSVPGCLRQVGFLLHEEEEMPAEMFPSGQATLRRWIRRR